MKRKKAYILNQVEPCDLRLVPEINQTIMDNMSEKLYDKGFELDNEYKITRKKHPYITYLRRFVHKELCTEATVSCQYSHEVDQILDEETTTDSKMYLFGMFTEVSDGKKVVTSVGGNSSLFKQDNTISMTFYTMDEMDDSITEHLQRTTELMTHKSLSTDIYTKDFQTLYTERLRNNYDTQVKYGIMKHKSTEDYYYMTWRGTKGCLINLYTKYFSSRKLYSKTDSIFRFHMEKRKEKVENSWSKISKYLLYTSIAILVLSEFFFDGPIKAGTHHLFQLGLRTITFIGIIYSYLGNKLHNKKNNSNSMF